jgi:hypothetical protein
MKVSQAGSTGMNTDRQLSELNGHDQIGEQQLERR